MKMNEGEFRKEGGDVEFDSVCASGCVCVCVRAGVCASGCVCASGYVCVCVCVCVTQAHSSGVLHFHCLAASVVRQQIYRPLWPSPSLNESHTLSY